MENFFLKLIIDLEPKLGWLGTDGKEKSKKTPRGFFFGSKVLSTFLASIIYIYSDFNQAFCKIRGFFGSNISFSDRIDMILVPKVAYTVYATFDARIKWIGSLSEKLEAKNHRIFEKHDLISLIFKDFPKYIP